MLSSWMCSGAVAAFVREQAKTQTGDKPAITASMWTKLKDRIHNIKPKNVIMTYDDVSRLYESVSLLPCSLS